MDQGDNVYQATCLQDKGVIVVEYPKSGGTWFVSMLADALGLPKRDVYIDNSQKETWDKHFWFQGQTDIGVSGVCVAKSHELPGSTLHAGILNAKYIHLIRDGRDVVVSKYYYETDFLVNNGLADSKEISFSNYLAVTAKEWQEYITAWRTSGSVVVRYEDLVLDTATTLQNSIRNLNIMINSAQIQAAINNNTKDKLRIHIGKMFCHNTFIRKGIIGDWKNYFCERDKDIFKYVAGDLLIELGYEQNKNW